MVARSIRVLWLTLLFSALGWTLLMTLSFSWENQSEDARFTETLQTKAKILNQSVQSLRSWVGGHGGIYVRMDDKVKPNPLMAKVPERDLTTPSGHHLTLYNSPALLRQIMGEFEAVGGNRVRFSSLHPLNPANLADPWERKGIERLAEGAKQVQALTKIDDRPYYRLMTPMILKKNCLKCHVRYNTGQVGMVIGAVTVSIDAKPDMVLHHTADVIMLASHLGIWGVGLLGLVFVGRKWWLMLSRLELSATHDPLTGLYNRKELMPRLKSEIANAERYHHDLALIMFDIDHFKQINDNHGHQAGDEVLKALSRIIKGNIRLGDWVVRYGGEEFLLICPHANLSAAMRVAERIRHSVMAAPLQTQACKMSVTISAGVATYMQQDTLEALIKTADDALYEAKRRGRNCVFCNQSATAHLK